MAQPLRGRLQMTAHGLARAGGALGAEGVGDGAVLRQGIVGGAGQCPSLRRLGSLYQRIAASTAEHKVWDEDLLALSAHLREQANRD
jgi:hypothetical protein